MTFKEAESYAKGAGKFGIMPGLKRIRKLLDALGRPDRACRTIHVAGTNGKGSTCAYLASILMQAGYHVGRYSSPEIRDYLDRFTFDEKPIKKADFADYMDVIKKTADKERACGMEEPTQFELETALAFLYFARKECDVVIMEAGMGGTLDATNVIEHPIMAVITPVSLDHMDYLGDCTKKIAREKAGIIKGGHPVIVSVQTEEVLVVLKEAYEARERKSPQDCGCTGAAPGFISVMPKDIKIQNRTLDVQQFFYRGTAFTTRLLGTYQAVNASCAVLAAEVLQRMGLLIEKEHIQNGIRKAGWPYRFMVIYTKPPLVLDGAHNPKGAECLSESVRAYFTGLRIIGIMGVFKDKDYDGILEKTACLFDSLYTVPLPDESRGLSPEALCMAARGYADKVYVCKNYQEAARLAGKDAGKRGVVISFGSLSYLPAMETAWRNCYGQEEN